MNKGPGAEGENDYAYSLQAPPGWKLPSIADLKELINVAGDNDVDRNRSY